MQGALIMQDKQKSTIGSGIKASMLCRTDLRTHLSLVVYYSFLFIFCLLLIGCETTQRSVPIVDRAFNDPSHTHRIQSENSARKSGTYIVQKGDTLYSIALQHDVDHEVLAKWNGIRDPRNIKPGRRINVIAPSGLGQSSTAPVIVNPSMTHAEPLPAVVKKTPKAFKLPYSEEAVARLERDSGYTYPIPKLVKHPAVIPTQAKNKETRIEAAPSPVKIPASAAKRVSEWMWPATGKLISNYSKRTKGIIISGNMGQPVLATAKGKVVYSGDGLRGYGKLIIVKHNNTFLSAYAHNSKILVKESESVEQGQKIAEMGMTDTDKVKLHFEIRKHGKPVNPMKFLPSESSN